LIFSKTTGLLWDIIALLGDNYPQRGEYLGSHCLDRGGRVGEAAHVILYFSPAQGAVVMKMIAYELLFTFRILDAAGEH
jgi:hypothetical protein